MKKKLSIIGHYGKGKTFLDGQTVKTKILTEELVLHYGEDKIGQVDTYGGKKVLPKLILKTISALRQSESVIILPAHNGLRVFVPILNFFNKIYKRKLFYVVIGGWLPTYLKDKKSLAKKLKKFDGIFVETNSMKNALEDMGFANVKVMPNCKKLQILKEEELAYPQGEPYKLCTFSRVMKEKGIEDAVNAVKAVNEELGRTVYTLDIYGQVDAKQVEWFADLQKEFPEYIKYGGLVPFDKSVEVLKNYYMLLFPTLFYTEGIPGTIIDAFSAGLPVLASEWESYADVLSSKDSITYKFSDSEDLYQKLKYCVDDIDKMNACRKECLKSAEKFTPSMAFQEILLLIDGKNQ